MATNIKIALDKKFFAARVKLSIKYLEQDVESVGGHPGYRLFGTTTGFLDELTEITQFTGEKLAEEIKKGVSFWDRKGLTVTLYWLPISDKYEVVVPWGYKKDTHKINGTVSISISITDVIIKKLLQLPLWETINSNGIHYEYLSDYFIDSVDRQNGLSIWIRDQVLNQIIEFIDQKWDGMRSKDKEELNAILENCEIKLLAGECKYICCNEIT